MMNDNNIEDLLLLEPEFSNHGYEEIDVLNSSDDENFDPAADNSENIHQKNKRHQNDYSVWHNFESRELFEGWWAHEVKNWHRRKTTNDVEYWLCVFSRKMNYQCPIGLKIQFVDQKVFVHPTTGNHHHTPLKSQSLNEETKEVIKQLMNLNFKPAQIRREIWVF
jgi:hypothetical protein